MYFEDGISDLPNLITLSGSIYIEFPPRLILIPFCHHTQPLTIVASTSTNTHRLAKAAEYFQDALPGA